MVTTTDANGTTASFRKQSNTYGSIRVTHVMDSGVQVVQPPPPPPPQQQQQQQQQQGNDTSPPSRQQEVWISFVYVLLGIGVLLPWNAFISANSYFQTRFCGIFDNVELWFGSVYNLSYTAAMLLLLFVSGNKREKQQPEEEQQDGGLSLRNIPNPQHVAVSTNDDDDEDDNPDAPHAAATPPPPTTTAMAQRLDESNDHNNEAADNLHSYRMAMVPLGTYLAVFCVTTAFVLMTVVPAFTFWTMVGLVLCGISTGVSTVGIMTSSVIYPVGMGMNSFSSGQAAGGVLVAVANFVAAWMFGSTDCRGGGGGAAEGGAGGVRLLLQGDNEVCLPYRTDWGAFSYFLLGCVALAACLVAFHVLHFSPVRQYYRRLQQEEHSDAQDEERLLTNDDDDDNNEAEPQRVTVASVWRKVALPVLAVFGTLFGTLTVFPAWTSQIQSVHQCPSSEARIWNDLFTPLSFVLYNVGDLIGRLLSAVWASTITSRQLVLGCTLRMLIFFPLFYGVHTSYTSSSSSSSSSSESFRGGDVFSTVLQLAFAITNGLLLSLVFGHYPTLVSTPQEQEIASSLITLALGCGLVLGSLFSFVYAELAMSMGI